MNMANLKFPRWMGGREDLRRNNDVPHGDIEMQNRLEDLQRPALSDQVVGATDG
jgi:hypothetical protein